MKNVKKTIRQAAAILMNNNNITSEECHGEWYNVWKTSAQREALKKGLRLEEETYWAPLRVYVNDWNHPIKNIRLKSLLDGDKPVLHIVVKLRDESVAEALPDEVMGMPVAYELSSKTKGGEQ